MFSFLRPKQPVKPTFLALGDSIISDCYPGKDKGAAALVFRNQDRDFPEFCGRDLATLSGAAFLNLSRSGFQLEDVIGSLMQVPSELEVRWLLLSVGGNDLLSGELEPSSFEKRFSGLLRQLQTRFAGAELVVLNAYDPTDGTGLVQSSLDRGLPARPQLVEGLCILNQIIARVAGPNLADIHSHFLGHGVRHGGALWFQRDIEPNGQGASEVRRPVIAKLARTARLEK